MLNVAIVAQAGRIGYQAVLCAASIRAFHSAGDIRIFICVPKNSELWETDPGITDAELMRAFEKYGCEINLFDNADFGSVYPHSNKIYAVGSLPAYEPFLFLDSDTVLVRPIRPDHFRLAQPAFKPGGPTWPAPEESRSIGEVWRSLYAFFEIDPEPYRDPDRGDNEHQCYPYYNAGVVYFAQAENFAQIWLGMAKRLWLERPSAMQDQPLKPWLDQIVLPLVLAKLGVPRSGETDPVHKTFVHYHFPFYLQVRYVRAAQIFAELLKDDALTSVLQKDEGFRYYMSEEVRAVVREVHEEFANSERQGGYKGFQEKLRHRVSMMR